MDYNNVYNLIDLYLKNEKDSKRINLNFTKTDKFVILKFHINNKGDDETSFDIPLQIVNNYVQSILNKIKDDCLIIDEKYELDSRNKNCVYTVKFNNGRIISFNNFSVVEINNIRNILYNINIRREEIRVSNEELEEPKMNYKPKLQPTGFVQSNSLFLIAIILADIFMISLWIFKILIID